MFAPVLRSRPGYAWRYQEILAEPPRKFAEETFFALLLLLTCGGCGIVYPILSLLGIPNDVGIGNKIVGIYFLFFSVPFSIGLLVNLYYRAKRVTEWAILKARGQRIFSTDLVK